jgi:hypothetical protein
MISACAEPRFARTIAQKRGGGNFFGVRNLGAESQEAGSVLNQSTGIRSTVSSTPFRSNQAMRPEAANARSSTKTAVVISRVWGIRELNSVGDNFPAFALAAELPCGWA